MNETDLPTERTQTGQDPRFPQADVDQGRPSGDSLPSGEGTPSAVGVTRGASPGAGPATRVGPVRSRRTFEALRTSSRRGRAGPISVSFIEQPSCSRAEMAFAINRRVGNAVVRNRLRRRLKAIASERATRLPVGAYMVHTGPAGPGLTFEELRTAMSQALERATGSRRASSSARGHDHSPAAR